MDIKRIVILFLLLLLFGWIVSKCSANDYCPEQETIYAHNKMGELYTEYGAYLNLYKSVGMKVNSSDIDKLNDIKLEVINLKTPECLDQAKYYVIESMNEVVSGLYLYKIGDTQGFINKMSEGSRLIALGDMELTKLRRCFPNCTKEDME